MPLGLIRLNERRQRPNQNISFIKVKDGPEKEIAEDILERVAAIVWPIMRDNGLGVMSLEDFPPNREFWGRNFNAGECIQLVLKSPTTGLWLPFSFVCKVMPHELAHIKQMNHSRAFHAVRIGYHKEFDALVARGYSGDGFWSRGHTISEGLTAPRHLSEAEMPDNLCGGTYRSAKKPEKRKLTYAERKERRKQRLFGKGEGEQMGADEKLRATLEKGKSKKAIAVKPRVAQSQRGRNLRLEAALRREQELQAEASSSNPGGKKEESDGDNEESEYETEEEEETVDVGGGKRMVRIASVGEDGDEWAEFKDEMNSMCSATALDGSKAKSSVAGPSNQRINPKGVSGGTKANGKRKALFLDSSDTEKSSSDDDVEVVIAAGSTSKLQPRTKKTKQESQDDEDTPPPPTSRPALKVNPSESAKVAQVTSTVAKAEDSEDDTLPPALSLRSQPDIGEPGKAGPSNGLIACSVCTMENTPGLALCAVCGNVLDTDRTPSWKCKSSACKDTTYSNPNDAGICGCCGSRRLV